MIRLEKLGVEPEGKTAQALILMLVNGYSQVAAAREVGITPAPLSRLQKKFEQPVCRVCGKRLPLE
jgi:hypothetical protein